MIQSLLIANRGEIAGRIIHTAWAKGIRTVPVFSDADAKALHVRQTDKIVRIGLSATLIATILGRPSFRMSRA